MTKKGFGEFMAKVAQDAQLRREVDALAKDDKGVPLSALAALGARKGYAFRVEDVSNELTDEEVGAVAGGLLPAVNISQKAFPKVQFLKYEVPGGGFFLKLDYK